MEKILTNKYTNDSMGKQYLYSTRWEQNVVANIHIYVARAIFLLFYDNQDIRYEPQDIYIGVSGPIFKHKNIKVSMGQVYP